MKSIKLDLLTNPQWLKCQAATILATTGTAFFTLWTSKTGYTEREIIGLLAFLYTLTFLPLLVSKTTSLAKGGLLISSVCLLLAGLGVTPIGIGLCAFIASMQLSRDLFYIGMMDEYVSIAKRHKVDTRYVIGLALLFGLLVSMVTSPLIGYTSETNANLYFIILSVIGIILTFALERTQRENRDKRESRYIPSSVIALCSLSLVSNIPMFFIRYFVIPMAIIKFAGELGFSDNVMVIAGTLISLMTAIGFLVHRRPNPQKYIIHMSVGLFASLLSCVFIVLSTIDKTVLELQEAAVVFLLAYASLEVTSKVWTVNFIAALTKVSSNLDEPEVAYKCFAKYKSAGGAIGYGVAFLLIPHLESTIIGLHFTIFAFGFCGAVLAGLYKEKWL
ncbi:hypothetical protein [Vibrio sp. D431a]|uniref:hypothetical protein n=1 Tax=Vibrio sp. D431a TaxID=2837388 RepID=UPI002553C58D|nr:hypothetical protein [Vibrio sp. D431a]MDK9790647.1 hypothetical protein [Vibrio sp. D431a]